MVWSDVSECPNSEDLRRFEAGEISGGRGDALDKHVSNCVACAENLDRLRRENLDSRVLRAAVGGETTMAVEPGTPRTPRAPATRSRAAHLWDIPDYERVRLCGEGAYGTVWAVRDRVGLYRALKTIDLDALRQLNVRCRESTALEAYCRKVRRHPNLIEIFHVGMQGSLLYYTMELADDEGSRKPVHHEFPKSYRPLTLHHVLHGAPLSAETAIEVILRLLRGLSRLHAMGLAHRDIKPANIVFVKHQPKLADIGMITANTSGPSNVGTPDYMPPDGHMDLTADTYAMGRMLYQLMVGLERGTFPTLPSDLLDSSARWDMERINSVLEKSAAPKACDRFENADRMLEEIESCRNLAYDSLFADLGPMVQSPSKRSANPYTPIIIASINALPWVIGLVLLIVVVQKLL